MYSRPFEKALIMEYTIIKYPFLDLEDDMMSMDQKKLRLQTSMRMLKDEPVPEGYMRYR